MEAPVLAAIVAASVALLVGLGNIAVSIATLLRTRENGLAIENFKQTQAYLANRFGALQSAWELCNEKELITEVNSADRPARTTDDTERIQHFKRLFANMLKNGKLASRIYKKSFYHLHDDLHKPLHPLIEAYRAAQIAAAEAEAHFQLLREKEEPTYDTMTRTIRCIGEQAFAGQKFMEEIEEALAAQLLRFKKHFEADLVLKGKA